VEYDEDKAERVYERQDLMNDNLAEDLEMLVDSEQEEIVEESVKEVYRPSHSIFNTGNEETTESLKSESIESSSLKEIVDELSGEFKNIENEFDLSLSYFTIDIETGEEQGYNQDKEEQPASKIKLGIMYAVFYLESTGELKLNTKIKGKEAFKPRRVGLQDQDEYTVEELLYASISDSDNYASNLLIDRIGLDRLNRIMSELGYGHTKFGGIFKDGEGYEDNKSTARDMAYMMRDLIKRKNMSEEQHKVAIGAMKLKENLKYLVRLENEDVSSSFKIGQTKNSFGALYGNSRFVSSLSFNTPQPTFDDSFQLTKDYGIPINNKFISLNRNHVNKVNQLYSK